MPSPFSGMDPYLEDPSLWMDFHQSFITYLRDTLLELLPDQYEARIEERINLVSWSEEERRSYRADVAVASVAATDRTWSGDAPGVATVEPVTIPLALEDFDETHEAYVQITNRSDHQLVTTVELLSPTNKRGAGGFQYKMKRKDHLSTPVHLVEIDLLIEGDRLPLKKPLPPGHYYVYVARGDRRPDCQIYAWSLRQSLPVIAVPLLPSDPDLRIDLQDLFNTTYDRGRYRRSLKYSAPPSAALSQEDLQRAAMLGKA